MNFVEKVFYYRNVQCSVVQNGYEGYRCGYIAVNTLWCGTPDFSVHGGLTYHSRPATTFGTRIRCRVTGLKLRAEEFIVGFDCGHCFDKPDLIVAKRRKLNVFYMPSFITTATVKSQRYVECELRRVVDILHEKNKTQKDKRLRQL